ncbi:hypothetical protein [Thalassococcus lentus]|uniref:Uncharacterized protein n=1 Tax=Thalassococcus lentus TaxID=1210524 RepID=A0ABT4XNS3_9RHOB|nr:hypothetical protein [Thalassococcus lentus]MDA7423601.1 hypothetical protein [Thalassococcus lentus]
MNFSDRLVPACALAVVSALCALALLTSQTLASDGQTLGVLLVQQVGLTAGV